jgi:hypothetical protein
MLIDPCVRPLPAKRMEMSHEFEIWIELARRPEIAHDIIGANRMNENALRIIGAELAIINQLRHERNRSHFSHQRGIEADFVHAIHDFASGYRYGQPLHGIDVHD